MSQIQYYMSFVIIIPAARLPQGAWPTAQRPPDGQASPNGGRSRAAGEGGYLSLECHPTPKLHALRKKEKPSLDREGARRADRMTDVSPALSIPVANAYKGKHAAGHHLPNQPPLVRGGPGAKRRGRGRTIVQVENELNGHLLSGRCPSGRIGDSGTSRK